VRQIMLAIVVAWWSTAEACAAEPAAAEPLTTARAIAAHVTPADGAPWPVRLEAVVTYQDPVGTIFLRDETGATFITDPQRNPRVSAGRLLRVVGETFNGLFIGGIRKQSLTLLDQGPLPEPRPITPALMEAGSMHYDWVWLEGVGRELIPTGETTATLVLGCGEREVEVRFDVFPNAEPPALVDGRLRIAGLAAGDTNDRRQVIRPYLRSRGMGDVTILDPAPVDPFAEPEISFAEVGRRRDVGRRVRIEGVVTAVERGGGLFLHDGERGMYVAEAEPQQPGGRQPRPGDRVAAVGFPAMGVFSAFLERSGVRVIGRGPLPAPVRLTDPAAARNPDCEPVVADLEVLQREDSPAGTRLLASQGPLAIRVDAADLLPAEIVAGARVRVVGICRVSGITLINPGYSARPTAYTLLPATAADVTLLAGVPSWTPARIARLLAASLAATAIAGLLAVGWAFLLKRQVGRQLAVIEGKLQDEAAVEERRRIAREFHDSLEQELAALTLRLDAAASCAADPEGRSLLERERSLAARLQTETRQFVWDLRDPARAHWTLEALLAEQIEEQQAVATLPIRLAAPAGPIRLPPVARYHLLRIIREAVHNALEHSGGTAVDVGVAEQDGRVVAVVADDGTGFDLAARERAVGHFGIRGMRERARRIGGTLAIEPRPGGGTRVVVGVPVAEAESPAPPAPLLGTTASVPRLGVSS
jgi:signal transduction histidine kinase